MCFSAGASFGAGVVLTTIGIASIKKAETGSQIIFASIPILFAVQQVTEGFVWLSHSIPAFAPVQNISIYIYLFFAQVLWPVWIPFSILKLEPKEGRRKAQKILVGIGVLVSLYFGYCLSTLPVYANISAYHVSYIQNSPAALNHYRDFLYIIATIVPSFISSVRRMWILGATILISYIITTIFYTEYIVSVWCFFASIISIAVLVILYELNNPNKSSFNRKREAAPKMEIVT